jgi:hypothetical protein
VVAGGSKGESAVRKAAWVLFLVFYLFVLYPGTALAKGEGVIRGRVANRTAGGGSAEGREVILRVFQGPSENEPLATRTDAQGQFQFEGLETGSDWAYLVRVEYEGVLYSSGVLAFQAGQDELVTEIEVYETTTDGSDIRVERAHLLIALSHVGLQVTELYVFDNPTDRTYVGVEEIGGRWWTSRFALPQGSFDLTLDDGSLGGRFLSTESGFVDTEPQWPGGTQVLFSYALDCPSGTCDLTRELAHPIADLNVLIVDRGATVDSEQLVLQGKMDAEGRSYLNYTASDLLPGRYLDLRVRLAGATPPATAPARDRALALPWIVLGTVLTGLVLVYPFWRRRIEAAARKGG